VHASSCKKDPRSEGGKIRAEQSVDAGLEVLSPFLACFCIKMPLVGYISVIKEAIMLL
jgi:hypothetical protein